MASANPHPAAALLAWYRDMGVDDPVGEAPVDLTALPAARALTPAPSRAADGAGHPASPTRRPIAGVLSRPAPQAAPTPAAPVSARQAIQDARTLAAAARDLVDLEAAVKAFDGCPLKRTATNTVFADGNPNAGIMVIGEAPGSEEDRQGLPFVGPAGQLLDRMLAAIDLDRAQDTYITNILPWRPPGNRTPNPGEIAMCLPFMERHIALVQPQLILLSGGTAAKAMLGSTDGIMRLRGRWRDVSVAGLSASIPAMPLFHPAFLLRTPGHKRTVWKDLLAVRRRFADMR